jgi:hypothetical protein
MFKALTNRRLLLVILGLTVGIMALAACGSGGATPPSGSGPAGGQQASSTDPASLLRSDIGAAAFEQLVQGLTSTSAGANTGVWVNGQGEAAAEPDQAVLNLGVAAFAGTVAEARTSAAEAIGQMLEVLKARGIADRDIQTRSFNINARYTTHEITRCLGSEESGTPEEEPAERSLGVPAPSESMEPTIVLKSAAGEECVVEWERVILGYDVTNQLSVKVRDLDSVGSVIDEATEAGGDLIRFQGVSFSIEDTKPLRAQARAAAVEDLMAKAGVVASLAGVELGDLVYITETGGPIAVTSMVAMERAAFADGAAATPIQAGELQVVVNVQGAFNIQHP